jgi:RNA polymerase sigma-70 factor (ECF subfamily)
MEGSHSIELFKELYLKNAPRLTYFANKYVDRGAAEDIVQDIFLKVWQKKIFLLSENGLRTYLFNAIRNACLDYLKHQSVEQNYMSAIVHKLKVEELQYNDHPVFLFQEDERIASIYNEIEKLPEKCREIFTLSYLHEKKSSEIATMLNISRRTVEAQLYKALKLIRNALQS